MKSHVLDVFCKPDSWLEHKRKPFVNNGYVVGTDGYIVGYVKKENIEDADDIWEADKDYIGAFEGAKGTNPYNLTIKLDELIDAIKTVEYNRDDVHLCPDCKGSGIVTFEYYGVEDYYKYTIENTCPVCDGKGVSGNYEYIDLLNGWVNKKTNAIDIEGCWFKPKYLEKLAVFMKNCNVDACTFVSGDPSKGCCFNIADGVDVGIMPVFHSDEIENVYKLKHEC